MKKKNILICYSGAAGYHEEQTLVGIRRFALTQPDWRLGILLAQQMNETMMKDVMAWKPSGVLVVTPFSRLPKLTAWRDLPMVVVDHRHQHPEGVSRIEVDAVQAGNRAASYFLQNGFRTFAVVLWPRNPPFSRLLEQGYMEILQREGITPARFQLTDGMWQPWHRNPELDEWLRDLPKPTALFCVSDSAALRIFEHCERLEIGIPYELSVLTVGNIPAFCETTRPTISSIPTHSDTMGFRAATILDRILQNPSPESAHEPVCEMIEAGEVIERQSSNLRAIEDPGIAKAADYLLSHVAQGVSLEDAARETGLNRRRLERGFKRHLGVTPGEYLRRLKIDHAKHLIRETDLRMNEVAYACGMAPEPFSTLFRKETGRSPGVYRKEKSRGTGGKTVHE